MTVVELPTGTVTFLFTDIEGSTRLLKELGPLYGEALADHQRIVRAAFAAHGGREVDTQGDSFFVAFGRAKEAVAAAVDAQRDLAAHTWPAGRAVRVRMGLHTGEPRVGGERYVGLGVHRAARIAAAGHGGQVLLSRTTRDLVEDELPTGVTIRDLGERRLKDLDRPEPLSQLVIEGLQSDFARLKTLDEELRRRRRLMYAGSALIGVLAAAVAIPIFALGQGSRAVAGVAPNSLAVIDARSNAVVGSVPVGVRPAAVAGGESSVWVANLDDKTISRVDPQALTKQRDIPLTFRPTGLAVGFGSVWVVDGAGGTISRIDPGTDQVAQRKKVAQVLSFAGFAAVGSGAVWTAYSSGEVARVDPTLQGEPVLGFAGFHPLAIAVGLGAVWVANGGDATVSQILPATTSTTKQWPVGRRPSGVAVGAGFVWITDEVDDNVWRIDPVSGSSLTIPVGHGPTGIAYGEGRVWVADSRDGTVSEIDPTDPQHVVKVRVGNQPTGVAVAYGRVWVSVQAPT